MLVLVHDTCAEGSVVDDAEVSLGHHGVCDTSVHAAKAAAQPRCAARPQPEILFHAERDPRCRTMAGGRCHGGQGRWLGVDRPGYGVTYPKGCFRPSVFLHYDL